MSKLDNLIGFWNNKSTEVAENRDNASKKPRPKSENYDNNSFSRRMEFFDSPKNHRGDFASYSGNICPRRADISPRPGPRADSEFKGGVKCGNDKADVISDSSAISDVKIIVTNDDDNENNSEAEHSRRDSNASR